VLSEGLRTERGGMGPNCGKCGECEPGWDTCGKLCADSNRWEGGAGREEREGGILQGGTRCQRDALTVREEVAGSSLAVLKPERGSLEVQKEGCNEPARI